MGRTVNKLMFPGWHGKMRRYVSGVVALEFLLLFPLVVSLVYAAGVYGVLFSWQVRMQVAVDRSTAQVMYLDRSATSSPETEAVALANGTLAGMGLSFLIVPDNACSLDDDKVVCTLSVGLEGDDCGAGGASEGPEQLGFFDGFPPLPDCLTASSRVAF